MNSDEIKRLDEIKAREDAATNGPWDSFTVSPCDIWAENGETWVAAVHFASNIDFVKHVRADIPWLLKLVAEQETEIQRLKELAADKEHEADHYRLTANEWPV